MKRQAPLGRAFLALGVIACGIAAAAISWNNAEAQPAAKAPAADAVVVPAGDAPIVVPDGDAATLEAFIDKLAKTEPEGDTQEAQIAYVKKVLRAILEASNRMLKAKPNEEQKNSADTYRLIALQNLSELGDEDAKKEYEPAIEKALTDARPEIAVLGWRHVLRKYLGDWESLDAEAKTDFFNKIVEHVKTAEPSMLEVNIVYMTVQNLDRRDDEFIVKLLKETLPILAKSESEKVKGALEEANLEGMQRRLTLMGQPMEISGELLGGGKIDWKSYRGKVVLVDFSATWCGPCREEAPNVLAMYDKYHDKGFDVIAVSLDRTPEAAAQYVKDNGIKWATLFPEKEDERFWNHPLVRYYGVSGIPTAILVDKEGKVVNMDARDAELRNELQRLLGDPATAAAPSKTPG